MCTHARQMAGFFAEAQVRYDKIMGCAKFGAVRQPRQHMIGPDLRADGARGGARRTRRRLDTQAGYAPLARGNGRLLAAADCRQLLCGHGGRLLRLDPVWRFF